MGKKAAKLSMQVNPVLTMLGGPCLLFAIASVVAIVLFDRKIVSAMMGWAIYGGGLVLAIALFFWLARSEN